MVIVEVAPGLKKEIGWLYMKHFIGIKSSKLLQHNSSTFVLFI